MSVSGVCVSAVVLRVGTDILYCLACMHNLKQEMLMTAIKDGLLEVHVHVHVHVSVHVHVHVSVHVHVHVSVHVRVHVRVSVHVHVHCMCIYSRV